MTKKIKIFFVVPTLFAGGAERVISFVSQNLDKEKFDSTLIVIGLEKESKFPVSGIPVIYLNKTRVLRGIFSVAKLIKREKPQVAVSTISHLNSLMGLISILFKNTVFIGRHACILNAPNENKKLVKKKKPPIMSTFNYFLYGLKKLDYMICQSADMKQSIMDVYDMNDKKIRIINNPVTQTDIIKTNDSHNEIKKFITIGRLSKTKGHLRILDILGKLSFPFQYTIVGEGVYYDLILKKIKELGLEDNITFVKYTDNVSKYLVEHDMFLQGSYSEGFPNALLESCAVGTPVIAFNSPGGTKEIVEDEVNGFLVEDEDEFLKRLNDKRNWNPEVIRESVYKKFNKNIILNDYEQLFFEALELSN